MLRPYPASLYRHRFAMLAAISLLAATASLGQAKLVVWASLDRDLAANAPQSNFLVAELRGGGCSEIHGRDADQRLALASTFKLYVLGELARQIQAGTVHWNDQVSIQDNLRSMPSGNYAFVPAGTDATVQDLATAMIRHSDNTATDHLIDLLGRENVERAFAAFGHGDPAVNIPLLLTRELFAIKMSKTASWIAAWERANDADQLMMLQTEIDPIRLDPTGGWGMWHGPKAIDGVEWFASANELCRVTSSLWTLGAQRDLMPVRTILTGARGGVDDQLTLADVGYKGGYEAGVVNMTFVVARSDNRVFFVTAGYNDPIRDVDGSAARADLDPVFKCLARVNAAAVTC